ncbi:unnamed protein product [Arctogadus glacialis]
MGLGLNVRPSSSLSTAIKPSWCWRGARCGRKASYDNICPTSQKPQGSGIANLTFDLFKLHPKEFLGCLSIRATLYEMYTFSYDLGYTRAKPAIKGSVRLLTHSARLAGQLLLYGASSALSAIGKDDDYHYFDGGHYILCIH